MGQHSDRVREALLDAAEELFAREGIDAVSNRRISEHAGSANNSAVAYHFGSREDLLRALLDRHAEPMAARRQELVADLGSAPTVHDIVRCRLLPLVELLDSLPRPSWRAQFLAQMRSVPSAVTVIHQMAQSLEIRDDFVSLTANVPGVPAEVLRARSSLIGHFVMGVCAEQEAQMNTATHRGDWLQVGYFLIDAAAGMISAPVTHPGRVLDVPGQTRLV